MLPARTTTPSMMVTSLSTRRSNMTARPPRLRPRPLASTHLVCRSLLQQKLDRARLGPVLVGRDGIDVAVGQLVAVLVPREGVHEALDEVVDVWGVLVPRAHELSLLLVGPGLRHRDEERDVKAVRQPVVRQSGAQFVAVPEVAQDGRAALALLD